MSYTKDRPFVGGMWMGVDREPQTRATDDTFNEWIMPVYEDLYGPHTRPGLYINAFMIKSVLRNDGSYNFSVFENLLATNAVRQHGATIAINIRLEGKVFPAQWDKFLIPGKDKKILDLSNPSAMSAMIGFIARLAGYVNQHPVIQAINISEMSGSSSQMTDAKVDLIEHMVSSFPKKYVLINQNRGLWDHVKNIPGVGKFTAGPKLFEDNMGRSGNTWKNSDPVLDGRGGRYGMGQTGNLISNVETGEPRIIYGNSIEPNEFRVVGGKTPQNNPWIVRFPHPDFTSPVDPKSDASYPLYMWFCGGEPKNPERARKSGISAVGGILPCSVICIHPSLGRLNYPGLKKELHDAIRMFGRKGINSLFNPWVVDGAPDPDPEPDPDPDPEECPDILDDVREIKDKVDELWRKIQ